MTTPVNAATVWDPFTAERTDREVLHAPDPSCRICCEESTPQRGFLNVCAACKRILAAAYPNDDHRKPTIRERLRAGILEARASGELTGDMIYRLKLVRYI